ncbi:MAG: hypothetical protein U1E23_04740 [Reyranellaceae bacterium]
MNRRRLYAWISTLIGIVFALALIELTAIVWLYLEDGQYTPAKVLFERAQNTYVRDLTKKADCRYVDTLFPHPFLAFVHNGNPPCGLANINNIGLFNDDFLAVKRADRYVVLLTGGSVASQLGQNFPSPPAPRYLEEELNRNYVSPNGKPFLVLNGGDGAWKQPQQLIIFSMYATTVDAVVTLDGYNEHYYFRPGTPLRLESPASNFLEVNPFAADENFGDAAVGWVIGRVAGLLGNNPFLSHSHAAYMVIRGIERVAKSKDRFGSSNRTTLTGFFALPKELYDNPDTLFALQLGLYQKYARGIEAIARDNNLKSAYFLQPVPAWGKTLSEEEKKVVGSLDYGDVYRRIVAGMLTLRDRGLALYDLGDLLKDQPGTFYEDDIHFIRTSSGDSPGYRLMAARMGSILAQTWNLQRKP